MWIVPVAGGAAHRFERTRLSPDGGLAWAPGARILYQRPGNQNFHFLDPQTGEEELMLRADSAETGWTFAAKYSPTSRQVAVYWNRNPRPNAGVYLISLEGDESRRIIPGDRIPLGWSTRGDSVYVMDVSSRDLELVPRDGGAP